MKFYKAHIFFLNSQFLQHTSFQAAGHVSSVLGTKLLSAVEDTQRTLKVAVQRRGVLKANTKTILRQFLSSFSFLPKFILWECGDEEQPVQKTSAKMVISVPNFCE